MDIEGGESPLQRSKSQPVAISPRGKDSKKAKDKKKAKKDKAPISRSADDAIKFRDVIVHTSYKAHKGYVKEKYVLTEAELAELHIHLPPAKYEFTAEERSKLVEFRKALQCITAVTGWTKPWHNDDYFRRWLIARDWSVDKAADMFVEAMKWREREDIDNIVETFPKNRYCKLLTNYWPNILSPVLHSKDGHSVVLEAIGRVDPKLINLIPKEFFIKWHIYEMEVADQIRRQRAAEIGWSTGVVLIEDLSGFGMSHFYKPALDALTEGAQFDKAYYPEGLRKMYFINSPTMFQMLYKMIKVFYDPRTLNKIEILGSNYEEKLKAIIPDDELIALYGGKQDYSFPPAGPVRGLLGSEGGYVRNVTVPRSGFVEEVVTIKEKGALLGWEFSCEDYDIAFCCIRSGEGLPNEIEKFDAHKRMIIGFLTVDEPGKYILRFDNAYSWARSKTVHYRVFVDAEEVPQEGADNADNDD